MLNRNWRAICAVTDPRLKMCVALATDEKVLEGLQRGFPELFTAEKPEHDGPWPLSVLRRIVEESCGENSDDDFGTAYRTLEKHFGFPCVEAWLEGVNKLPEGAMRLTEEESEIIWEVDRRGGGLFPQGTSRVAVNGIEYFVGWVGDVTALTECYLFPCELVDENA
ncbi:MAG: hypothetical protein UY72_C0029G0005 [Candidatus Uhrbacteria bacterium GW2011_GWD2_52_7]|uniref:Uncharacterized protein n=1 Tax=Candidatus Uhrbacteria bacterium GW2011_GWD2_52_7 TaxID=1618989 RepID=A0A0G1ZP34_9BACT|nr:MAG: hypothetical protein UY72_C0029G0005 [Candidatus Uhrbacteria bacterium GW2011_GWD2_52_7]